MVGYSHTLNTTEYSFGCHGAVETVLITYAACITQYFGFVLLTVSECLLLPAMAHDWYVAIYKPQLYTTIMIEIMFEIRKKTFYTCASHLTSITIFFGSLTFSYIHSSSRYLIEQKKAPAVFCMLLVLMLNPLIDSLRNKEVRSSFRGTSKVRELFH
ncbi:putative olfactory receptor 8G3 pseudogene [Centrocercus urophasianus]|uniref:putative olfactory receptor 8G3 pseudogene n=1 Tax=Centrocercus urophasianus TaxID=9002 RepID=UPI001C64E4D6|nr:putative olfactory receptor 8G3 pseudogene [Centrocercus urophasianus]